MTANPPTPYAPTRASKRLVALTLAVAVVLPLALFGGVLVLSPIAKPEMIAAFVREVLGHDPATWPYTTLLHVVAVALLALVLLTFGAVVSGSTVWWEMRVSSRMQSRIGYNRVGAGGFFQWIADAVKLLLKEDLIPADADRVLFRAAPYFVFVGFALVFVALPFVPRTPAGKLIAGLYALYAGLGFLVAAGLMFTPVVHRVLHKFHWEVER